MKKLAIVMSILLFLTPIRTEAQEIDFASEGFQVMSTTAYCMGEITASGTKVRPGIAAVDRSHMGYTALVYTLEGEFLGYYECLDTGSSKGITSGHVIDIYRSNLTHCQNYMKITGGKVWVKYIWAEG